jgi:Fe-S cluster assembly protein SufD
VQCSHGTTVGQLDEEALFYLRSRGLSAAHARRMLCMGFAGEIIDGCRTTWLRQQMEGLLEARLGAGPEAED